MTRVLHTVNKPGQPLSSCIAACSPDDAILLLEDGVHAAWGEQAALLAAAPCRVYLLAEDVALCGIGQSIPGWAEPVDYGGFVTLVTTSAKTQSWY